MISFSWDEALETLGKMHSLRAQGTGVGEKRAPQRYLPDVSLKCPPRFERANGVRVLSKREEDGEAPRSEGSAKRDAAAFFTGMLVRIPFCKCWQPSAPHRKARSLSSG